MPIGKKCYGTITNKDLWKSTLVDTIAACDTHESNQYLVARLLCRAICTCTISFGQAARRCQSEARAACARGKCRKLWPRSTSGSDHTKNDRAKRVWRGGGRLAITAQGPGAIFWPASSCREGRSN